MMNIGRNIVFILFICLLIFSCRKKEVIADPAPLKPYLKIEFGYYPPNTFYISPFTNQDSILVDSFVFPKNFAVSISELDHSYAKYDEIILDSIFFEFDVKTGYDSERYNSKNNIGGSGKERSFTNVTKVYGYFQLPYKFSKKYIPGNDTLELNDSGDQIEVNYVSVISDLKGDAKLKIIP
jgi:hypothetical protein